MSRNVHPANKGESRLVGPIEGPIKLLPHQTMNIEEIKKAIDEGYDAMKRGECGAIVIDSLTEIGKALIKEGK